MKIRNLDHSDNWATPPQFYNELNQEFNFDFDPCPLNTGPIERDKDGLLIAWGDRNYINPPYSRELKEAFVKRALAESQAGKLCVLLLPVSTSTALFHEVIQPNAKEIRFVKKRVNFIGVNKHGQKVNFHLVNEATKDVIQTQGGVVPLHVRNAGQHDSMVVIFDGRHGKN